MKFTKCNVTLNKLTNARLSKQVLKRMWNTWNSHSLLMGMENGTTALEKQFTFKRNVKYPFTIDPTIPLLVLLKRKKNIYPHTYLYMNVQSSLIHNSPKLETVKCS